MCQLLLHSHVVYFFVKMWSGKKSFTGLSKRRKKKTSHGRRKIGRWLNYLNSNTQRSLVRDSPWVAKSRV